MTHVTEAQGLHCSRSLTLTRRLQWATMLQSHGFEESSYRKSHNLLKQTTFFPIDMPHAIGYINYDYIHASTVMKSISIILALLYHIFHIGANLHNNIEVCIDEI